MRLSLANLLIILYELCSVKFEMKE